MRVCDLNPQNIKIAHLLVKKVGKMALCEACDYLALFCFGKFSHLTVP